MELMDIVCEVSKRTRYTRREIRKILRVAASIVKEELSHGRNVSWRGMGRFENVYRKACIARDPRTHGKTTMHVPPGRRFRFVPCKEIVALVKKSKEHFQQTKPEERYLPKEKRHGKVRSGDRPQEGRERKDSGGREGNTFE